MTLEKKLESSLKKQIKNATDRELYDAIVAIVKEEQDRVKKITGEKKLYYISAEFLIGKQLGKNLINLGLYDLRMANPSAQLKVLKRNLHLVTAV